MIENKLICILAKHARSVCRKRLQRFKNWKTCHPKCNNYWLSMYAHFNLLNSLYRCGTCLVLINYSYAKNLKKLIKINFYLNISIDRA